MYHTSIKTLAMEERPREKLMAKGATALTNRELLALLINTGTKNKSVLQIADDILMQCQDNLLELGRMEFAALKRIKGIGKKKAITLLAALELGKRRQNEQALQRPHIHSSQDAFHLLASFFMDKNVEVFYVAYLNVANRLLKVEPISLGGLTSTVVDSRVVFRKAFDIPGVTQLVLAHNHPSGNLKPSDADCKLTERIKQGGLLLEFKLLDHLIIAGHHYFSFADQGLL